MLERVVAENNYINSPDKSRQTYLNNKQNLTPAEQQDRDQLNRKDVETTAGCDGETGNLPESGLSEPKRNADGLPADTTVT